MKTRADAEQELDEALDMLVYQDNDWLQSLLKKGDSLVEAQSMVEPNEKDIRKVMKQKGDDVAYLVAEDVIARGIKKLHNQYKNKT